MYYYYLACQVLLHRQNLVKICCAVRTGKCRMIVLSRQCQRRRFPSRNVRIQCFISTCTSLRMRSVDTGVSFASQLCLNPRSSELGGLKNLLNRHQSTGCVHCTYSTIYASGAGGNSLDSAELKSKADENEPDE